MKQKNKQKHRSFLVIICLFILVYSIDTVGQTVETSGNSESQSFIGDTGGPQVDHATGIMNYLIPLINEPEEYRVDLVYAASGIKVAEKASVAGIGWNIRNTGVVRRIVRGIPDDEPYGILRGSGDLKAHNFNYYLDELRKHNTEGENDIFEVSYGNLHVRFYLEEISTPGQQISFRAVPLERTEIQITCLMASDATLDGFSLIDKAGNSYTFKEKEKVYGNFDVNKPFLNQLSKGFINAWYLTNMKLYDGRELRFEYGTEILNTITSKATQRVIHHERPFKLYGEDPLLKAQINDVINQSSATPWAKQQAYEQMQYLSSRLEFEKAIKYNNEIVSFNSGLVALRDEAPGMNHVISSGFTSYISAVNSRINSLESQLSLLKREIDSYHYTAIDNSYIEALLAQLYSTYAEKTVDSLNLYTKSVTASKLLRTVYSEKYKVIFDYEFIPGAAATSVLRAVQKVSFSDAVLEKVTFDYKTSNYTSEGRPFLSKIYSYGSEQSDPRMYTFEYVSDELQLQSHETDYWGFYNGPHANTNLIPAFPYYGTEYESFNILFRAMYLPSSYDSFGVVPLAYTSSKAVREDLVATHSLKKVTFPEGGYYEFEYESNSVNVSFRTAVGGIRIKRILLKDGTDVQDERIFKYEAHSPLYSEIISSGFSVKVGFQSFGIPLSYQDMRYRDIVFSSEIIDMSHQISETGNENVFYSHVEEVRPGMGKTTYQFLEFHVSDSVYPYWLEKLLLNKTLYNEAEIPVQIETFRYQISSEDLDDFVHVDRYDAFFDRTSRTAFSGKLEQYKPFPVKKIYDFSISDFPDIWTGPQRKYNPRQMFYEPNLSVRVNPILPERKYYLKTGGAVLLSEKRLWTSSQTEVYPFNNNSNVPFIPIFNYGLQGFSNGINRREIYRYKGHGHDMPTEIETEYADGSKELTKIKYAFDYSAGISPIIDSLRSYNYGNREIERQYWNLETLQDQWRLRDAELFIFDRYVSSGVFQTNSFLLPRRRYVSNLETPILGNTNGFAENVTAVPPYQALNYAAGSIYRLDADYHYASILHKIQLAGITNPSGVSRSAQLNDHNESITVIGVDAEEVTKIPNVVITDNIRYDVVVDYISYIFRDNTDNIGFLEGLKERLAGVPILGNYSGELKYKLEVLIEHMLNQDDLSTFWSLVNDVKNFIYPVPQAYIDQFNGDYYPSISFNEITNVVYSLNTAIIPDQAAYYTFFKDRNYITHNYVGSEVIMPLAKYLQSGKRLLFLSDQPVSRYIILKYDNTLPDVTNQITLQTQTNGLYRYFLDLGTIPNSNHLKNLCLPVGISENQMLFVVPEDAVFFINKYDERGVKIKDYDSRGNSYSYGYDGRGRLIWTKDRDGNMMNFTEYNLGTN